MHKKRLGAGIHLALIVSADPIADTDSGEVILNKNNDEGLKITFETGNEDVQGLIMDKFWFGEKTQWKLDLLCKACNVDNEDGAVDANELIGNKVWLYVAEEYYVHNATRLKEDDKLMVRDSIIPNKFGMYMGEGLKPVQDGDPEINDGVAAGIFVKETPALKVLGYAKANELYNKMQSDKPTGNFTSSGSMPISDEF